MLTVTLIAYVCTTALMDDCEVYAHSHYQGKNSSARCEIVRQSIIAANPGLTVRVQLSCETEVAES